ncbi:MAG: hypothetical protein AB1938_25300 [Myxococcota bacterium]
MLLILSCSHSSETTERLGQDDAQSAPHMLEEVEKLLSSKVESERALGLARLELCVEKHPDSPDCWRRLAIALAFQAQDSRRKQERAKLAYERYLQLAKVDAGQAGPAAVDWPWHPETP